MPTMCMQCCGERKTAEVQNEQTLAGGQLLPLPVINEAVTWVPTPQGVVPTCYQHIVVITRSPLVQPGNGHPLMRPL